MGTAPRRRLTGPTAIRAIILRRTIHHTLITHGNLQRILVLAVANLSSPCPQPARARDDVDRGGPRKVVKGGSFLCAPILPARSFGVAPRPDDRQRHEPYRLPLCGATGLCRI